MAGPGEVGYGVPGMPGIPRWVKLDPPPSASKLGSHQILVPSSNQTFSEESPKTARLISRYREALLLFDSFQKRVFQYLLLVLRGSPVASFAFKQSNHRGAGRHSLAGPR